MWRMSSHDVITSNRAAKDPADTGDDCAAPDGKTIDDLQRADQDPQAILELLR